MRSPAQLLFVFALLVLSLFNNSYAEPITILTSDYVPWTAEKSKYGGFVNRVVREAFARQGVQVNFVTVSWKRAEVGMENGVRAQASSFWFSNPAIDKDYVLSDPVSSHQEMLFHRKGKTLPKWKKLNDLVGLKFGVTRGYTYTAELWELSKSGKLRAVESATDETSMKRLIMGDLDVFPMDEMAAKALLSDTRNFPPNATDLVAHDTKPLKVSSGYIRFPPRGPQTQSLVKKLNAGLAELKNDGTYKKFYDDLLKGVY